MTDIALILIFLNKNGEKVKVNTIFGLDKESIDSVPLLLGATEAWNFKSKSLIKADIRELQNIGNYALSLSEGRLSLYLVRNYVSYYNLDYNDLMTINIHIISEKTSTEKIDLVSVFRVLDFLSPDSACALRDFMIHDFIETTCDIFMDRFNQKETIKHNEMVKLGRDILSKFFNLDQKGNNLPIHNFSISNRIRNWPLLVHNFAADFKNEVFNYEVCKISHRAASVLELVTSTESRLTASHLVSKFNNILCSK